MVNININIILFPYNFIQLTNNCILFLLEVKGILDNEYDKMKSDIGFVKGSDPMAFQKAIGKVTQGIR